MLKISQNDHWSRVVRPRDLYWKTMKRLQFLEALTSKYVADAKNIFSLMQRVQFLVGA